MIRKFRNITSLLLLLVFLLPTVVKLEHRHQYFALDVKNEQHNLALRSNCPICNFEFSIFISSFENFHLQNEKLSDVYLNNYNSRYNSNLSQFSFLLRAPPEKQI